MWHMKRNTIRFCSENFKDIKIITIGESIGEKSELDLIPFEGEWFAVIVVEGIK